MVTIYDTYNGLLDKIRNACNKQKLKYTEVNKYSISIKYNVLNKLNIEYDLTDFF